MLMLLGVSDKLTRQQRDIVTPMVIQGFTGEWEEEEEEGVAKRLATGVDCSISNDLSCIF
jgi:hypothetical protein